MWSNLQINMHTACDAVRVKVLVSKLDEEPQDIAWHYDIVITTFQRLSTECSSGKQSKLTQVKLLTKALFTCLHSFCSGTSNVHHHRAGATCRYSEFAACMQIHWLRIILDEGHMLGTSLTMTGKLKMAISLRAERRWVMTGTPPCCPADSCAVLQNVASCHPPMRFWLSHPRPTDICACLVPLKAARLTSALVLSGTPTPNTPTSHVAHLQPLLAFLGHQPYGTQRKIWEVGPWLLQMCRYPVCSVQGTKEVVCVCRRLCNGRLRLIR